MTKKILETLNLPPMEDIFPTEPEDKIVLTDSIENLKDHRSDFHQAVDHSHKMDEIHKQTLQHAADLMEFGYNSEPNRSRGFFEIAAAMYGRAIEAGNSKREAQQRAIKLALDQRKVEVAELLARHEVGQDIIPTNDAVIVFEDRNALLKRLSEQKKETP